MGKNEMPIEVGILLFITLRLGGGKVPFHNVPSRYTRDVLLCGCGAVLILVPAQIITDY